MLRKESHKAVKKGSASDTHEPEPVGLVPAKSTKSRTNAPTEAPPARPHRSSGEAPRIQTAVLDPPTHSQRKPPGWDQLAHQAQVPHGMQQQFQSYEDQHVPVSQQPRGGGEEELLYHIPRNIPAHHSLGKR